MPDEPVPVCADCGATTRLNWCAVWERWLCVTCKEARATEETRPVLPPADWDAIMNRPLTGEFAL